MQFRYCGLIDFPKAMELQCIAWNRARAGRGDCILGFELEPVVTLGARGNEQDLIWSRANWSERGFHVLDAERGGQATIHNPGQLVIFPVMNIRRLGVRNFVNLLSQVTAAFLAKYNCEAKWNACDPGFYTSAGKVVSLGLRIKSAISTHGLAINVHNDLGPFSGIRICGRSHLSADRLHTDLSLDELFSSWCGEFKAQLTSRINSPNLGFENDRGDVKTSVNAHVRF